MSIELTGDFGARVAQKLRDSGIIWLITLKPDGTPEPNPVWFYWDGATIFIRSQDNPKVRNIAGDPRVVLHFDTTPTGSTVEVIHGSARVVGDDEFATVREGYLTKYADGIVSLGSMPERMLADYRNTIAIEPTRVRGW